MSGQSTDATPAPLAAVSSYFTTCSGAGFEPEPSGRDQGYVLDCFNSRVSLENLGLLRRFPIGRLQLYPNALEQLPSVSDDLSMTCRIRRYLSFAEREEIALARAAGESIRQVAARLGRSPSTISRELARNADRAGRYRAGSAHVLAHQRPTRPKPAKLVTNHLLRERVQSELTKRYSPEQIAGRLREDYPDQPEMWVSTETIYQS